MSSMVPIKQNSRSILASCYLKFSLRSSPALPAMDDINYRSPAKTFSRLGRASLNGKSRQCNMSAYDNMWPEQRRTWRQQRGPARTLRGPKEAAEERRKNQGNRRRTSDEPVRNQRGSQRETRSQSLFCNCSERNSPLLSLV